MIEDPTDKDSINGTNVFCQVSNDCPTKLHGKPMRKNGTNSE